MTPDQNREEIENLKRLLKLEKSKFIWGILWIAIALVPFIYFQITHLVVNQNELPVFLSVVSFLFALMIVGLNQLINGFTSNAVETEKFQIEVKTNLNSILGLKENSIRENKKKTDIAIVNKRETIIESFIKIGFLIFVIVYIVWFLWIMWQHSTDSQYITTALLAIPSFFVAVVTFLYVLLTRDLIKTNQDLVAAQSQPSVIAHVKENDLDFHYIDLIIENVGMGIANNIKFDVEPHGFITQSGDPLEDLPVIQNGIPTLGPKQKFSMVLRFLPDLMDKGKPLSDIHDTLKFQITIRYQNSTGEKKGPEKYDIDIGIFWGLRYCLDRSPKICLITDSSGNLQNTPPTIIKSRRFENKRKKHYFYFNE
jgi:hypothetical protein